MASSSKHPAWCVPICGGSYSHTDNACKQPKPNSRHRAHARHQRIKMRRLRPFASANTGSIFTTRGLSSERPLWCLSDPRHEVRPYFKSSPTQLRVTAGLPSLGGAETLMVHSGNVSSLRQTFDQDGTRAAGSQHHPRIGGNRPGPPRDFCAIAFLNSESS